MYSLADLAEFSHVQVMRDPRMQTQTQPSTLECNFKALTDYQESVPPGDPSTHPGVTLKLTSK